MNRRGFLQRLVGASAVVAVPPTIASEHQSISEHDGWPTIDHPLLYGAYEIHWTGWKASQEHSWMVGQWIAWPRYHSVTRERLRVPHLYVNAPGCIGGPCMLGAVYNLSQRGRIVSAHVPDLDTKQNYIWEARKYILQLADAYAGEDRDKIGYGSFAFPVDRIDVYRL